MENKEQKEDKENNEPKIDYIYFIDSHAKEKQINISLSPEYKDGKLEKIEIKDLKELDDSLCVFIYRFNIIPESFQKEEGKKAFKVTILAEDEKGTKDEFIIVLKDIKKDYYEYSFKLEKLKVIPLRNEQEFEIYIDYLRKNGKKQASRENEQLILSTQLLTTGSDKRYDLLFYAFIFVECSTTRYAFKHLLTFKPERIRDLGYIPSKKLNQIKNIINITVKNPSKIRVEKEDTRPKTTKIFYSFALLFNLNCCQEKLPDMFKNEQISCDDLYNNLYVFKTMFRIVIENNILIELLKTAKIYDHYLLLLSYNGKDTIQFLTIINEQKENLLTMFKEAKNKIDEENKNIKDKKLKKNIQIINVEKYAEPKKEDDINQLFLLINLIIVFLIENKIKFIEFSPTFFDKYIDFCALVNLNNLLIIKQIIEKIKKLESKFETSKKMSEIIHNTGINMILEGKLKNKQVLEFIKTDEYYQNPQYIKKYYRTLDIFLGIDINTLEEDFFNNWKQINFYKMFEPQKFDFLKTIANLVKEMKDFGLLYSFYDIYQEKEYKSDCIICMQNRFNEIIDTYSAEKCTNFEKDVIKLIYLSDKSKVNVKKFLSDSIYKALDNEKINKIYLQLIEEHPDISKNTKDIIVEYFTKNQNNANIATLLSLIKNCKKLRQEIFSNINKYIIKEEDFFSLEETENYKFYEGIVKNKLLETALKEKGAIYITKAMEVISCLENKISNYDINFKTITLFISDDEKNNKENVLYERLKYIYTLDEGKAKQSLDNLKLKLKEVKNYIKDLELVYGDFRDFFYTLRHDDIEKLAMINYNLKNESLNYFDNNCKNDYEKYKIYLKDAKSRDNKKRSIFYNELYKDFQNKIKDDDKKRLEETEKNFAQFKNIFVEKGINKINIKILNLVLKPFQENEEKLKNELKILADIFEVKDFKSLEVLYEQIILISKRSFFFNVATAINTFIENIKPKQTNFTNEIKDIATKLQGNDEIETIKNCYQKLKDLKILDENDRDNKYIDILIKFKEQPESIIFLLKTSLQEIGNLQELAAGNDNNYVTVNDLLDMGKCVEFFKNIGTLEELQKKNDNEIIELLKLNVPKTKDIAVYFEKYVNNYGQISILKASIDKSEVLKNIVQGLFNGSEFILSNTKENSFLCTYKDNNKGKEQKLEKEYIISLRERALLTKKITPDYKYFIDTIAEIAKISNILSEICMKGYPENITIKVTLNVKIIYKEKEDKTKEIEIEAKKDYYFNDNLAKNYNEILEKLTKILSLLNQKIIKGYETHNLVRYIYGRKFNLLYNNFNTKDNYNMISFLKYITNDLYKNDVINFKRQENGEIIENTINDCQKYLSEVLNKNNLTLEKIYQNTVINQKITLKGVYTYLCVKPEKELFQICKYLTGNNPVAQNVLLCNKETTNEEITAFLYRAILYKLSNSCFIIAGIELLDNEQKECIINLLNNFFPKGDEIIETCLIILYTTKSSDIYKSLEMKKYKKILEIDKKKYDSEQYNDTNIEVIKSDKSGVGKSTQIKLEIEKKGKKWIYFPFGGVFTREDIIKRLKNLKLDDKCVLHLDLYDTDKITLMMEFLFSLLITRFYGENEDIFYLSKNIEIKVETPNSFIDFFEKFPILTLFKVRELKISDLAPLIVPDDIESNVEVVANYLKALKEDKINKYDLIFPKITPDYFKNNIYYIKKKKFSTATKASLLPKNECQSLIFEKIKEKITEPTYYQITSFINVLAIQLKNLNKSAFLNAYQLIVSGDMNNCLVRTVIVNNFIELTKHFTKGAFTDLIKQQDKTHKSIAFGIYKEVEDLDKAIKNLSVAHDEISFDKIDPSLLFFQEGNGESFFIITTKKKDDKEYKDLLSIKNSQFTKEQKDLMFKVLPDYANYSKKQFLEELSNILDIHNPIEKKDAMGSGKISLEEITGDYVITADNFIKMILILLRIRSNIPVIMMGETGCGKTSLIRKLSEMKNNGDKSKMFTLNIHAGTNDNDIIKFIEETVVPIANIIGEEEKEIKQKTGEFYEEQKIWVFLDEINTCKSMGLISELMCKHTCQGRPIPSNIVFIAACNPYRERENKGNIENEVGLDIKQARKQMRYLNVKEIEDIEHAKSSNLVYTVNPLPHSLLNFVFDFGSLKEADEEKYIRCIIKECINKTYYKEGTKEPKEKEEDEDEDLKKLKKIAGDMIIEAHKYIKSFSDKSAVSLREIRRFNIFYDFFYDYLNKRKAFCQKEQLNVDDNKFYSNLDHFLLQAYAINLSIFICYYLRITDKEKRKALYEIMNKLFKEFGPSFSDKDFLDLPLKEEKFIVENIKLDKGIAKNRALLENIYSLFVTINSKVPIFIVGKPGCSKSLSVQLILKSMQGSASDKPFFKEYPKIMVNSYQGSFNSTSKGVETIFNKARNVYKELSKEEKEKNIPLIFFDEMGLAEHSPNNPLKVIHAELEYDQNKGDKKVAFIGISNWVLDAAKMNRGISISIPEPDEDDNKETSLTIGQSYDEILANRYKDFFENLGTAYFEYKKYLKEGYNADGKADFHGNRDFYHLVKNASRNILAKEKNNQLNNETLVESAIDSIERNFSGIQFTDKASLEIFKTIFSKMYPCQVKKEYDVLKRIQENIVDLESRYLLVFTKSSISTVLLSSILSAQEKPYSFYIGSQFEKDLNTEEYALKVLNKIQYHMEKGHILILSNLESVYPNLYDLFNQNFTVLSNKNYARLAVGSNTNTFSYVNNDFRCIVSVDIEQMNNEEAPFLNRFEKHVISFEYLLNKDLIKEAESIKSTIDLLVKCNSNTFKAINYDLEKLLVNCSIEEIQALVYQANEEKKKKEEMSDYILEKIALTFPQDVIVNMKINGLKTKKKKIYEKIMAYYNKGEHSSLANFIKTMDKNRNIVYTFSNSLDDFENIDGINNPSFGEIKKENIKQIKLSSIKSESELEKQLDDFLNDNKKKVCVIKFLPYNGCLMNYMKYFIENKEKESESDPKKVFIFIVYIVRISKEELNSKEKKTLKEQFEIEKKILKETLSNLSGYYQIFIDNLNGTEKLKIDEIIEMKQSDLFKNLVNVDEVLCSNIFTTTSYMKYNSTSSYKVLNKESYGDILIQFIYNNKTLRKLINECIFKQTLNNKSDIIANVFKEKNIVHTEDIEIISVIKRYLSKIYTSQLSLLYFRAEKEQFFSSLISAALEQEIWGCKINEDGKIIFNDKIDDFEDKTIIEKIARSYLDKLVFNDGLTRVVEKPFSNKIDIIFGLKTAGIKTIYDAILKLVRDNISKKYRFS